MKKFFKSLAVLLALTLIIGVIPASAAETPVVKKSKILYVGGAAGETTDGKASAALAKVAIYKLAGYTAKTAEGHTFKAVAAADGIVKVGKKYIYPVAFAKTVNVDIYVDDVKVGTTVVKTRKNAETVEIAGLTDGQEVVVGKPYEVKLPRAGKDTDERCLAATNATVTESETAKRVFTVVFKKAGEQTVTAGAFQSATYNALTAKTEIKVNAVRAKFASVAQVSSTVFALTFDQDMTDLVAKADFTKDSVYTVVNGAKIPFSAVKDVKVDKNVVCVEMYSSFAGETEYTVDLFGKVDTFKTAKQSVDQIASVAITTTTAIAGEATEIKYEYKNADGIILDAGLATPTFAVVEGNEGAWITDGNKITVYKTGVSAVVSAKVAVGYSSETYETLYVSATQTITGVDAKAVTVVASRYAFGGETKDENHTIKVGQSADIAYEVLYSNVDNGVYADVTDNYTYAVADQTIAMIQGTKTVVGVNAGSTVVLVSETKDGKTSVVNAFPIEVVAASDVKSATIAVEGNKINTSASTGSIKLTINTLDQYGKKFGSKDVKIEQLNNNATAVKVAFATYTTATTNGEVVVTLTPSMFANTNDANKEATVVLVVKVGDLATKNVPVTVASYADADTYTIKASANTLETTYNKVDKNESKKTTTITINGTKAGFDVSTVDYTVVAKIDDATATGFYVVPSENTKDLKDVATSGAIAFSNYLNDGTQQKAGAYSYVAYKVTFKDGKLESRQYLGSTQVTVKAPATAPVELTIATDKVDEIATKITAKWNGADAVVTAGGADSMVVAANGDVFVKYVNVTYTADSVGSVTVKADVNKLFKK